MARTAPSLFWIAVCAVVTPVLAGPRARRLIPEVVLLLALRVVIGPAYSVYPTSQAPLVGAREDC
jgi:hypothetical protein